MLLPTSCGPGPPILSAASNKEQQQQLAAKASNEATSADTASNSFTIMSEVGAEGGEGGAGEGKGTALLLSTKPSSVAATAALLSSIQSTLSPTTKDSMLAISSEGSNGGSSETASSAIKLNNGKYLNIDRVANNFQDVAVGLAADIDLFCLTNGHGQKNNINTNSNNNSNYNKRKHNYHVNADGDYSNTNNNNNKQLTTLQGEDEENEPTMASIALKVPIQLKTEQTEDCCIDAAAAEKTIGKQTAATATASYASTANIINAPSTLKSNIDNASTGTGTDTTSSSNGSTRMATCKPVITANATLSTIPKWLLMLLMFFTILAQAPHQIAAEKSKHYYMQSLCKSHFLQQLYRKIDGAVLWSQNERNLDCIITFQTHSILQRFMLRFDMLQLDCNDHLLVYDGAHAVTTPKFDISCRQTKQSVSSILTRTNFVTLKYKTDGWGTDANGFKLVITSVKDPKHTCKDFTCAAHGFCIHPDLLCDGINHCGDNSDESVHNLCPSEADSTIFGVDMTWFVLIVVTSLILLSAIIVGISICVCRRQENGANANQNTAIQLHHTADTNGSSKLLHYHHHQHHGGTLSRGDHTTHLPHSGITQTSGNWHHPAGPSGYHRIQHSYLKMATKVRPIWCLANFVH